MKIRFVIPLLILFTVSVSSQSFDSLLTAIDSFPLNRQLEILSDECWNNRSKNPQYALECGKKGLEVAKRLNNKSSEAELNNFMGVIQRNLGNYVNALRFYNTALELAKEIGDSVQIAYSYNNIGGAYRLERNYTLALENIFHALRIFEKLNMPEGVAYCTINIGIIYRKQSNFDLAREYFERTLSIREELDDEFGKALALNQIVEIYYDQRKLDQALSSYQELRKLYEDLNDTKGIAAVLGGIGGIKYLEGKYDEAKRYRREALSLQRQIQNTEGIINNLDQLALISAQQNLFEEGDEYLDEAFKISSESKNVSFLIEHYKDKAEYNRIRGNYENALKYFKRHTQLKDSVAIDQRIDAIAAMEAIHRVELANKENKILSQENELQSRQNTFLIIFAIVLIIFISYGITKYYQNKKLTKQFKELNATKDKFFSIIAHDLKNPFNNLLGYSEMLAQDFDEMTEEEKHEAIRDFNSSSKKLLLLVENLLDWARANIGALKFEPEYFEVKKAIDDVVDLYSSNIKSKNLKVNFDIPADSKVYTDTDFFYLVARNLIHNAIKFSETNGEVKVVMKEEKNHYQIDYIDNGVGIEKEKLNGLFELGKSNSSDGTNNETGSGLGLILVRDLVTKWGGKIFVESEPGKGSKFSITIPKPNV